MSSFLKKKGTNVIKKTYLLLDKPDRIRLFKLLKGYSVQKELKRYKIILDSISIENINSSKKLLRKVIFSEFKYFGKLFIDEGAEKALKRPWVNLLPVGIHEIDGEFSSGSTVGVFSRSGIFLGVGVIEYSSNDLRKIIQHSSREFQELIGYFHTSCAIRSDFLFRFHSSNQSNSWSYIF